MLTEDANSRVAIRPAIRPVTFRKHEDAAQERLDGPHWSPHTMYVYVKGDDGVRASHQLMTAVARDLLGERKVLLRSLLPTLRWNGRDYVATS